MIDLGLNVCTGPVVDFRLRQHLRTVADTTTAPLIYPVHLSQNKLIWPVEGRKPNAIVRNDETERWLMPNGCYVVVRRFSPKEEPRRIMAVVLHANDLQAENIGFENHLNIIHQNKHGLPLVLAEAIASHLNSREVDDHFRTFSGHTQVNAADLRRIKFPENLAEQG